MFGELASEAKFFCLFNQPSMLEETQAKMTPFSENLQFLRAAKSNPAGKACHFISQRASEAPSRASRAGGLCVCVCVLSERASGGELQQEENKK